MFSLQFQAFPPPDGPLRWANVPWDQESLGVAVFQLDAGSLAHPDAAQALAQWQAERLPGLAWVKLAPNDVAAARLVGAEGFYLIETQLELAAGLDQLRLPGETSARFELRPARPDEFSGLAALAARGVSVDRFHLDPRVPRSRADARLEQWVTRAARAGEPVLVYFDRVARIPAGFFHYRHGSSGQAVASLGAVDREYQHAGVGAAMIAEALSELRCQGVATIETRVALANAAVLNLLLGFGFSVGASWQTFHGWKPAD